MLMQFFLFIVSSQDSDSNKTSNVGGIIRSNRPSADFSNYCNGNTPVQNGLKKHWSVLPWSAAVARFESGRTNSEE